MTIDYRHYAQIGQQLIDEQIANEQREHAAQCAVRKEKNDAAWRQYLAPALELMPAELRDLVTWNSDYAPIAWGEYREIYRAADLDLVPCVPIQITVEHGKPEFHVMGAYIDSEGGVSYRSTQAFGNIHMAIAAAASIGPSNAEVETQTAVKIQTYVAKVKMPSTLDLARNAWNHRDEGDFNGYVLLAIAEQLERCADALCSLDRSGISVYSNS